MSDAPAGTRGPVRIAGMQRKVGWPVPAALIALSVIPLTAGALRVLQLAGGPAVIPADRRFSGFPAALVVHILGAALFAVVGAFQFLPTIRRHHLTWHRHAGRVLAVAGLLVAGSALWMTVRYAQKPGTGDVLFTLRLVFASAMVASVVLGVNAARARNIGAHRAWMIRAYAIGLAAGTQVFTEPVGAVLFGTGDVRDDLAKGAGWVVNLAVAEWAIRRPASWPQSSTTSTQRGSSAGSRSSASRPTGRDAGSTRSPTPCSSTTGPGPDLDHR